MITARITKSDLLRSLLTNRERASWPWLLLGLLWVVATLNYLDRQVIFSIFPLLQRDLHASSIQLGLTSTIFLITYGIVSPFAGIAADRFGQRRLILASLITWSAACLLAGQTHSMTWMLATRGVMGISEAFYIPAALGLLVRTHSERFRALATGIHQSGCYAGLIAGGTIVGFAEKFHYGWRSVFAVLGVIGVLYGFVLWLTFRRNSETESLRSSTEDFRAPNILQSAELRLYTIVFMAFSIATWMLYTWLPLYLYERLHLSLLEAGFLATFWLQLSSFCGAFGGGVLSDRLVQMSPKARLLVQASGLALCCPFLLVLSHTDSRLLIVLALITIGLGRGCFDANTAPILAQILTPRQCSSAYGILNCAGCIIAGITTLAGGWMRVHMGFPSIFTAASGALVFGVAFLLLIARTKEKRPAPDSEPLSV